MAIAMHKLKIKLISQCTSNENNIKNIKKKIDSISVLYSEIKSDFN